MSIPDNAAKTPANLLSRRLLITLVIVTVTLAALAFERTTPARFIDSLTYDLRMAIAAPLPRDDVVIVKIDDRAIEEMRAQSACGCISPIDKLWLADIIAYEIVAPTTAMARIKSPSPVSEMIKPSIAG